MSAYSILAEHASAFATADAVTAAPSFDSNPSFPNDFLGLGFAADDEPVWNMSPMSSAFSNSWNAHLNPKAEAPPSFATVSQLERDMKNAQVRNGQPTPPLDEKLASPGTATFAMTDSLGRNAWDDTPTPPSSEDRLHRSSIGSSSGGSTAKRRRLRDHKPSIATTVSSSGIDSDDEGHEKAKREKFLERNRLAASKCRQKKKEHTMLLETRYKEQSDKREMLNAEIARLRSEILGLKNEVLRHAQCGDEPIKLHLAQMVKQIANKDRDDPTEGDGKTMPEEDSSPSLRGSFSFGFEEPLQLDGAVSLEQQIRRDSEASMAMSGDDDFNDLINV